MTKSENQDWTKKKCSNAPKNQITDIMYIFPDQITGFNALSNKINKQFPALQRVFFFFFELQRKGIIFQKKKKNYSLMKQTRPKTWRGKKTKDWKYEITKPHIELLHKLQNVNNSTKHKFLCFHRNRKHILNHNNAIYI